jgi:signal transduction histidine kinase
VWHVFDAAKRELGSLGLAVAGQIVTAHGGRILVRSTRPRDSRADLNVRSDTG